MGDHPDLSHVRGILSPSPTSAAAGVERCRQLAGTEVSAVSNLFQAGVSHSASACRQFVPLCWVILHGEQVWGLRSCPTHSVAISWSEVPPPPLPPPPPPPGRGNHTTDHHRRLAPPCVPMAVHWGRGRGSQCWRCTQHTPVRRRAGPPRSAPVSSGEAPSVSTERRRPSARRGAVRQPGEARRQGGAAMSRGVCHLARVQRRPGGPNLMT